MTSRAQPGNGLMAEWDLGESQWKEGMDENLRFLSGTVQLVLEQADGSLPTSPTNGVIGFDSSDGYLKGYLTDAWVNIALPKTGWLAWDKGTATLVRFDGTAWAEVEAGGGKTYTAGQGIEIDSTDPENPVIGTDVPISQLAKPSGKYWRLTITNTYYLDMNEVGLSNGGTTIDHTGVIATADKYNADAPNLIPGAAGGWPSGSNRVQNSAIINYEFPAIVEADGLEITPKSPGWNPKDFTLEVSTDGINWTQCLSVTGASFTSKTEFPLATDVRVPMFPIDAPADDKAYVRKNRSWLELAFPDPAVSAIEAGDGIEVTQDGTDPSKFIIASKLAGEVDRSPKIWPTLRAPFINLMSLIPEMTFTRASQATQYDAFGKLITVGANEPRFAYDPATGERLGFQIESQNSNSIWNSNLVESLPNRVVVTPNATIGPDGAMSMHLIQETTDEGEHFVKDNTIANVAGGKTYVFSYFVKDGPSANRSISVRVAGGAVAQVRFDPRTKVIEETNTQNLVDYGIDTELPNGIFRIWLSFDVPSTSTVICRVQLANPGNVYVGDGTSGMYASDLQFNEGTKPTSYIKTGSSVGIRVADSALITGDDFSKWFNPTEGSFLIRVSIDTVDPGSGTINQWVYGFNYSNNVTPVFGCYVNQIGRAVLNVSGGIVNTPGGTITDRMPATIGMSYENGVINFSVNGQNVGSSTYDPSDVLLIEKLHVMSANPGLTLSAYGMAQGCLQDLRYYPRALSSDELSELTRA